MTLKEKKKAIKKEKAILSLLYILTALGYLVIWIASGHDLNLYEFDNQKNLGSILLFLFSGISLFFINNISNKKTRYFQMILLIICILVILYMLYEIFQIEMENISGIFPILILVISLILSMKVLFNYGNGTN